MSMQLCLAIFLLHAPLWSHSDRHQAKETYLSCSGIVVERGRSDLEKLSFRTG